MRHECVQVSQQRQAVVEAQWQFFKQGLLADQVMLAKGSAVPATVAARLHLKEVEHRSRQISRGEEATRFYQDLSINGRKLLRIRVIKCSCRNPCSAWCRWRRWTTSRAKSDECGQRLQLDSTMQSLKFGTAAAEEKVEQTGRAVIIAWADFNVPNARLKENCKELCRGLATAIEGADPGRQKHRRGHVPRSSQRFFQPGPLR